MKTHANAPVEMRLHGWLLRDGRRVGRITLNTRMPVASSGAGDTFDLTAVDFTGPNGEFLGTFEEVPQ